MRVNANVIVFLKEGLQASLRGIEAMITQTKAYTVSVPGKKEEKILFEIVQKKTRPLGMFYRII